MQGIFNDAAFSKMKKGARVVNVARGGVIDDESLVRALDAGIVAQAALDVFNKEPPVGNPLVGEGLQLDALQQDSRPITSCQQLEIGE